MKKVLSVLLAAAMVMGMSVSAFAKNEVTFGAGDANTNLKNNTAADLTFSEVMHEGKLYNNVTDIAGLGAGDTLYFPVEMIGNHCNHNADKDWKIKVNNAEYVKSADFFYDVKGDITASSILWVKVVLENDFDHFEVSDEASFYFYVYDTEHKVESQTVIVSYPFEDYAEKTIDKEMAKDVIVANSNTIYSLADGINSLTVVFKLGESDIYVTAKMWAGEEYLIKAAANTKWSKELSKEYDEDITVMTIETDLDVREVLFESAKNNKQIVEVVDGALVAVDSEFVSKYELCEYFELSKGYIADAEENGTYALISADIELIEVEEEATEEETKENPSTGANDFVGAAVALAVVSVAAAGALALKK